MAANTSKLPPIQTGSPQRLEDLYANHPTSRKDSKTGPAGAVVSNVVDIPNQFSKNFVAKPMPRQTQFTAMAQNYATQLGVGTKKYAPSGRG
jgi:hypothetical protein